MTENHQEAPGVPPSLQEFATLQMRLANAQLRISGLLQTIKNLEAEIRRLEEINRSFSAPPPA